MADKTADAPADYLTALIRRQQRITWIALAVATLMIVAALIGSGFLLRWYASLSPDEASWAKNVPLTALAVTVLAGVWHSTYTLWRLAMAWGARAGQLEDWKLILEIKRSENISLKEVVAILKSLRRDKIAERLADKPPTIKLPVPKKQNSE